jgi:hypothetical protein
MKRFVFVSPARDESTLPFFDVCLCTEPVELDFVDPSLDGQTVVLSVQGALVQIEECPRAKLYIHDPLQFQPNGPSESRVNRGFAEACGRPVLEFFTVYLMRKLHIMGGPPTGTC